MIFGPDGALYGTTLEGGSSGYGVIFRRLLERESPEHAPRTAAHMLRRLVP